MSVLRTVMGCVVVAVASFVITVLQFLAVPVIHDALTRPKHVRVAFSELLDEVDAGTVDEICIHGHVYTFTMRRERVSVTKEALGPSTTLADAQTLRPSKPELPAPKLVVE
jgi:hypothetical protein